VTGSGKWRRLFYRQFLKITCLKSGDEKVRMKHRFHHLWSAGLGKMISVIITTKI
jgi:hypothetical protein